MPRRDGPRRHGTRGNESGAVAVEFALLVPLMLMLLFGAVTTGLSITHSIGLTNAVREGARFGATDHPGGLDIKKWTGADWNTWATDTIKRVRDTQFDDGATAATSSTAVCVDMLKVPATVLSSKCEQANGPALSSADAPPVSSSNIAPGTCVVRVWAARNFEINLVVMPVKAGQMRPSSVAAFELRELETCP